jgi:hypothetical protein
MKNLTIDAWVCYSEIEHYFDVKATRSAALQEKRGLQEVDIEGLKVSKCKIVIEREPKKIKK